MEDLRRDLAQYIRVLSASHDATTVVEERLTYSSHLAQAARLFAMVELNHDKQLLMTLVAQERRAYSWGCLSGESARVVREAFEIFAQRVGTG